MILHATVGGDVRPWLVVPTRGDRPQTLDRLLRDAGMPAVVVWTTHGTARRRHGADVVYDTGPISLSRWRNRGADAAVRSGADVIVIVSDDVVAVPGALVRLAEGLEGAALAWPEIPAERRSPHRATDMIGWCFALDPSALRPDEGYRWTYGDDDLRLRAPSTRIVPGVEVYHLRAPRAGGRLGAVLRQLSRADRRRFRTQHRCGGQPPHRC
jgi:hypothetical protein